MRVSVDEQGPYRGLRGHIKHEGDELVGGVDAELIIADPFAIDPTLTGFSPVSGPVTHFVTRWFERDHWHDQTFVGFPMRGLMNEGLGDLVVTGCCGRYVKPEYFDEFFDEPGLVSFLKELNHNGHVSIRFEGSRVCDLQSGVPSFGIYAILDALRGTRISSFFARPKRVYETWTGALLVSRDPYPSITQTEEVTIEGIDDKPNIWMLGGREFKGSWSTDETEVCVVTCSSVRGLNAVNREILSTCRKLVVPKIQYRTDMVEVGREGWAWLREKAIV